MTIFLSFYDNYRYHAGRGGHVVSTLDSGSSGLGSSPVQGHCDVFLGKTLYSHSAYLRPSVQVGTGKFNANFDSGESYASEPGGRRG